MGANSNGTPTSLGIPTLASTDAGKMDGINEITTVIDAKIAARMFAPAGPIDKQVVKWNNAGGAWIADFVDPGELKQSGATTGQALVWNGTKWAPGGSSAYRKVTAKTVNTTVAATDLLNGEITVGAGVLGTSGLLRLTAWGDWLQNSGGNAPPPRFQVLFGGTTLLDTGATPSIVTAGASREGWRLTLEVLNLGAANVQMSNLSLILGISGAAATVGSSSFPTGEGEYQMVLGASATVGLLMLAEGINPSTAVDTTAAKALVINVINGSASATYETKLLGALAEVV